MPESSNGQKLDACAQPALHTERLQHDQVHRLERIGVNTGHAPGDGIVEPVLHLLQAIAVVNPGEQRRIAFQDCH